MDCENVVLDSVDVDMDTVVPYYGTRLSNGLTTSVTKDYLSHVGVDRLSYIPIMCEQIKEQAQHIDPEILQSLLKGNIPTPLLKEFLSLHDRLGHIPFVVMYRLCSTGRLPSIFLVLHAQSILCPSLSFQAKCKPWRHVKRQAGTIRREHHTNPGDGTIYDQTMSAQKGLVPPMDVSHTRESITAVLVFLDGVSGYSFLIYRYQ